LFYLFIYFYKILDYIYLSILKRLHAPRQIVSNQNEYVRSKLTNPLTLVSIIFLVLYFPYSIIETLSYIIFRHSQSHCNINLILKRLTELLNIGALGIHFFSIYYLLIIIDHLLLKCYI